MTKPAEIPQVVDPEAESRNFGLIQQLGAEVRVRAARISQADQPRLVESLIFEFESRFAVIPYSTSGLCQWILCK